MTLTLRAVSLDDRPLSRPITAHFDTAGGSIGRSDQNTLALPDPERHISRLHAQVVADGAGHLIRNVSSANPVTVGGRALMQGESAPLVHGSQVRIGGYLLEVVGDGGEDADTIVRGRAGIDTPRPGSMPAAGAGTGRGMATPAPVTGTGRPEAPLSSDNPFAGLLDEPRSSPAVASPAGTFAGVAPAASGVPPSSAAWAAPAVAAPPLLPEDFDPFATPVKPAAAPPQGPAGPVAGAFDDLVPGASSGSIDEAFGLQSGARDLLADFMSGPATAPPASAGGGIDTAPLPQDPLVLVGAAAARDRVPGGPAAADDAPLLRTAYVPPKLPPTPTPTPTPMPQPPAAATGGTGRAPAAPAEAPAAAAGGVEARALWAAFCEGAGIACDPAQPPDPAQLRTAGSLLNVAVAGMLRLMTVRATARHELHAQVTMIQAQGNNPLKFSPDAQSALEQLLRPPPRGFLAGPAAMTDAMHDLLGHAIGTMAGTRAALEGVLDRFTPQRLETLLAGRSVLDSLLPMSRKARLWELYLCHYEAIRGEAQDDFHALFGRAFLAAYEQQLERLRHDPGQERPAPQPAPRRDGG